MKNVIEPEYVPKRQTLQSAGYDIYAVEDMSIMDYYKVFDTGVVLEDEVILTALHQVIKPENGKLLTRLNILQNYVGLVFPRSSMGFKYGLHFANTVCVIDQDYRDTIKISMKADTPFNIKKGERYAQLIFLPFGISAKEVRPTEKRTGGVGSTDKKLEDFE